MEGKAESTRDINTRHSCVYWVLHEAELQRILAVAAIAQTLPPPISTPIIFNDLVYPISTLTNDSRETIELMHDALHLHVI